MNSFAVVAVLAVLAAANAGVIQGPSSRTTVVGPDGSAIHAVAPGGTVVTEEHAGVVAHAAPLSYAAPIVAHAAYAAPVVSHAAYAAPALAYASPVAYGAVAHQALESAIVGPSGSISTSRLVASPSVYAASPLTVAHHGLYL